MHDARVVFIDGRLPTIAFHGLPGCNGDDYEIALNRADTPEKILAWVDHLVVKHWMTPTLMQEFIAKTCRAAGLRQPML